MNDHWTPGRGQHERRSRRGRPEPPEFNIGRRGFGRGPGAGPRSRARRGAVGRSILTLLADGPMHGYEMITALDERTGGAWKPSPGSMYPALDRLSEKGLIEPVADAANGKQRYQLTQVGRRRVAEMADAGHAEPWTEMADTRGAGLRSAAAEFVGPLRQIARFGSSDQVAAAKEVVTEATARLYQILADGVAQREAANPSNERTLPDGPVNGDGADEGGDDKPHP